MISSHRAVALAAAVTVLLAVTCSSATRAQTETQKRFWVAGRYDGDRIIVYFDAVQFNGTLSKNSSPIAQPVEPGFFGPVQIPATYLDTIQRKPEGEHFAIGDLYDLMLGNGVIATVKLTTLVGCETDEGVGNDSYVGAIATVNRVDALLFTKGYYAVRRHQSSMGAAPKTRPKIGSAFADLMGALAPFAVERQILSLLSERMKAMATENQQREITDISPEFTLQTFHLADGSVRYYARAVWMSPKKPHGPPVFAIGAWLSPLPTMQILAVQTRTSDYGFDDGLPRLLNAVDLGDNRTGLIVSILRGETTSLNLIEYKDGSSTEQMPMLQSISMGE